MSIIYCEKHARRWDSDFREDCPICENEEKPIEPLCTGCNKHPEEIEEFVEAAKEEAMTPAEYVRKEEGTYNQANGHFLCTVCYIEAGMPSRPYPDSWKAP